MKFFIFAALTISMILVYTPSPASAAVFSHTIKYEAPKTTAASPDFNLINNSLNNSLLSQNTPYVELKKNNLHVIVGKENNILGDGFIAQTDGICGVRTAFKKHNNSLDLLYGNDGQDVIAANFAAAFPTDNNLSLEALYFKTDSSFLGLKVSKTFSKNILFTAETSENLLTQAKGYLLTTKYGDAQQSGRADFSVSYRYVEPAAISDYSANTVFSDSQGVRFETNYKITDNLTVTAFQDFAQAQDKSSKDANNISLQWLF